MIADFCRRVAVAGLLAVAAYAPASLIHTTPREGYLITEEKQRPLGDSLESMLGVNSESYGDNIRSKVLMATAISSSELAQGDILWKGSDIAYVMDSGNVAASMVDGTLRFQAVNELVESGWKGGRF